MYSFISCSQKLGSIRVKSPIDQQEIIITMYGVWVRDDDAAHFVEQLYPMWCNKERKFIPKKGVYYATPTAKQMQLKPEE